MAAALGTTSDPVELVPGSPEAIESDITNLRKQAHSAEGVGQDLERVDIGTWSGAASQARR